MKYRPEIDGLRAVAVIPVILFHAGFTVFSGGFVGVDVFFVISGFLITGILIGEIAEGRFSLLGFYERRARRILPALSLVMAACIPFAWAWMLPDQFAGFARSLVAVSLFLSNILFWSETGYFDSASEEKPLLHTWSLAVEEQYYLLFPLALLLAWRVLGRDRAFYLIALMALASLALCEIASRLSPSANFYLLPTRAWELLTGSLCAFVMARRAPAPHAGLAALGLGLIVAAVFGLDDGFRFPSAWALAPVLGTALVLVYARPGTGVARLLSSRGAVGIGLISYSAYLWHQPLFAFARIRLLGEPPQLLMLGLAALTLALAWASWRYVERPFRQRRSGPVFGRAGIFAASGAAAALFIGVGLYGHISGGVPGRIAIAPAVLADMGPRLHEKECFNFRAADVATPADWFCTLGGPELPGLAVVIGDSHSLPYLDPLARALNARGMRVRYSGNGGCPPLKDIYVTDKRGPRGRNCNARNHAIFTPELLGEADVVILVGRWVTYGYGGKRLIPVGLSPQISADPDRVQAAFRTALDRTLDTLNGMGLPVLLVHQPAQQKIGAPEAYARAYLFGGTPEATLQTLSLTVEDHRAYYGETQDMIDEIAARHDLADTLDTVPVLCTDRCAIGRADISYYWDDDHLSHRGAARVVPGILAAIAALEELKK